MFRQILSIVTFTLVMAGNISAQNDASASGTESRESDQIKHRIVMHMSSSDTLVWKGLMNNIKHLREGWGETVAIEVVVHGPGIAMLMKEKTTQRQKIGAFTKEGIVFVACENTLRERKIDKASIIPEAGFVPMGVGEIVMKQEQGWSYIKVGF
ncbi:MAG: DsrE family protein [Chitinophagaceae bacterium]